MKNLKLLFLALTVTLTVTAQNALAEYIVCSQENKSYVYFDTPSLQLNIPEALPIPGNDNFFKGLFTMTEVSSDNYVATIKAKDVNYNSCSDENANILISVSFVDSENGQIKIISDCTDGPQSENFEIYKSNLICTRY